MKTSGPVAGCVRSWPCQPAEHQAGRRDLNQGLARLDLALVVLGQPPIPREPSKRALYYPPARLDLKAMGARSPFHDLQVPAVTLLMTPLGQFFAAIGRIRPDLLEARHEVRQTA